MINDFFLQYDFSFLTEPSFWEGKLNSFKELLQVTETHITLCIFIDLKCESSFERMCVLLTRHTTFASFSSMLIFVIKYISLADAFGIQKQ